MAGHSSDDSRMDQADGSFQVYGQHDGIIVGRRYCDAGMRLFDLVPWLGERVLLYG